MMQGAMSINIAASKKEELLGGFPWVEIRKQLRKYTDRRLTIKKICDEVNIKVMSKHLEMRQVAAKFVPLLLTQKLKEFWMAMATYLLQCAETNTNI